MKPSTYSLILSILLALVCWPSLANQSGLLSALGPTEPSSATVETLSTRAGVRPMSPPPPWAWARRYGGIGDDYGYAVTTDGAGNFYATGSFSYTTAFGPFTFTTRRTDAYIVKHDPLGGVTWARTIRGLAAGYSIAVGPQGDVFVGGSFLDTAVFDATTSFISAGSTDAFIACYSPTGTLRWARRIGGLYSETAPLVTVAGPRVIIVGSFVLIGAGATLPIGAFNLSASSGRQELYLASLEPATGVPQWAIAQGGTGGEYPRGIEAAPNGDVLIAGSFELTTQLAGSTYVSAGLKDPFVLRISAQGVPLWSRRGSGLQDNFGADVALDASGNVYLTGWTNNNLTFGTVTLSGFGPFLVKYDATGNLQWAQRALGNGGATQVAVARTGEVYIAGDFIGNITFGPTTLIGPTTYSIPFVAQYDAAGQAQWGIAPTNPAAPPANYYNNLNGLAVDLAGNVHVTGRFQGAMRFGATRLTPDGYDVFLARLASSCALGVPTLTAASVCAGQTLVLTATNVPIGATLQWSGPNGFSSTAAVDSVPAATAAASGTYLLVVTSAALGCSVGASVGVTVEAPAAPTITQTGSGPVTLTSSAPTGNQWYFNGQPIAGAAQPTYVVTSSAGNGTYTVVATSPAGCASPPSPPLNVLVTAVNAELVAPALRVYPNPTRDGRVTVDLTGYRQPVHLTVIDALGRTVQQLSLPDLSAGDGSGQRPELDLRAYPAGSYLLRAQTVDGLVMRRLVRE